jgi:hypothetical protein
LKGWGKLIPSDATAPVHEILMLNQIISSHENFTYSELDRMEFDESEAVLQILNAYNQGLAKLSKEQSKNLDKKKPTRR